MNVAPTTYRINVATAKLGVSRSTLYRLVDKGHLELITLSERASGITVSSYEAYIQRQQAAARPTH